MLIIVGRDGIPSYSELLSLRFPCQLRFDDSDPGGPLDAIHSFRHLFSITVATQQPPRPIPNRSRHRPGAIGCRTADSTRAVNRHQQNQPLPNPLHPLH